MMKLRTVFLACTVVATFSAAAVAQLQFNNTVDGSPLDMSFAPDEGRDTEAVKKFMQTGENIYNEDPEALKQGEELFLTACSGCHGHLAEGKLGPGLNDSYWTYPKNETDKGLFETIYGGAQGMMGPQYGHLNLDEMLHVMAWTRHLFTGEPSEATWLTPEQRKQFTPYKAEHKGG